MDLSIRSSSIVALSLWAFLSGGTALASETCEAQADHAPVALNDVESAVALTKPCQKIAEGPSQLLAEVQYAKGATRFQEKFDLEKAEVVSEKETGGRLMGFMKAEGVIVDLHFKEAERKLMVGVTLDRAKNAELKEKYKDACIVDLEGSVKHTLAGGKPKYDAYNGEVTIVFQKSNGNKVKETIKLVHDRRN